MSAQIELQNALKSKFEECRNKNPSYSIRAFARQIGASQATISAVLNGNRYVTHRLASKLLSNQFFKNEERREILSYFSIEMTDKSQNKKRDDLILTQEQYAMVHEWYHFAITFLAETKNFSDDPEWISKRLNIPVEDVKSALVKLEKVGMLHRNANGKLQTTECQVYSPDEIPNDYLKKAHRANLDLASKSLDIDDISKRDFTSMTISIDQSKIPIAKRMIRCFRKKFANTMETGNRNEVYKICVQFFPLSR